MLYDHLERRYPVHSGMRTARTIRKLYLIKMLVSRSSDDLRHNCDSGSLTRQAVYHKCRRFVVAVICPLAPFVKFAQTDQTSNRRRGATITYTCNSGRYFDINTLRSTSRITSSTSTALWGDPGTCTSMTWRNMSFRQ